MKLPGGLLVDGQLNCGFSFKPITGSIERAILESGETTDSLVTQVTNVLDTTLASVAAMPANRELIESLSSGDRQYLILQLEAIINPTANWLTADCSDCGELIQLKIIPGTLPVKPAGKNYPAAATKLSIGNVSLRVPSGADEEFLAKQQGNEKQQLNHMLKRLISQTDNKADIEKLTVDDLDKIDQILETMMPQTGNMISTDCPYCNKPQEIYIDIYAWLGAAGYDIENDIHQIASTYHWSEKEILALPKTRREHYLHLIEQDSQQMFEEEL